MKKQLVILLEYDELENCDREARGSLHPSDIYDMIRDHIDAVGIGSGMSMLEVITIDDSDAPLNFDKVVGLIKESVDDE